jgi:hypothetical protein
MRQGNTTSVLKRAPRRHGSNQEAPTNTYARVKGCAASSRFSDLKEGRACIYWMEGLIKPRQASRRRRRRKFTNKEEGVRWITYQSPYLKNMENAAVCSPSFTEYLNQSLVLKESNIYVSLLLSIASSHSASTSGPRIAARVLNAAASAARNFHSRTLFLHIVKAATGKCRRDNSRLLLRALQFFFKQYRLSTIFPVSGPQIRLLPSRLSARALTAPAPTLDSRLVVLHVPVSRRYQILKWFAWPLSRQAQVWP